MSRWWVLASGAALLWLGACTTESVGAGEEDATSCEGAYLDSGGRCRINGRFAKKVCCEVKPLPTERRTLEAYSCPSGDELIPVAFFDADSTLRISRSGAPTANSVDDVYLLPFAARAIEQLNEQGTLVAVVSNQGGVAAGHTTLEVAEGALLKVIELIDEVGGKVDYLDFADKNDDNRKPKTGMATRLDELLQQKCGRGIDWSASFMVGDAGYKKDVDGPHPDGRPADDFSNSDRGFAENLGIPFYEPTDYFDWRAFETYNIHDEADLTGLLDAIAAEIEAIEGDDEQLARYEQLLAEWQDNRRVNGLE